MDKEDIARGICEIKCVCISAEVVRIGDMCGAMADNIINIAKESPQNPEYRFKHLSEEPVG